MTTTNATTREYRVDRNGFPIETCGRCGGAKYFAGFSHVQGGACFGCSGAGVVFAPGKAGKLAAEYHNARRAAASCTLGFSVVIAEDGTRTCISGAQVGDIVRPDRRRDVEWRTVAALRPTRRVVGECYVNSRLRSLSLETVVEFTDGSTATVCGGTLYDRKPNVEALTALRDRLAAEAREAYERLLAGRARRGRR